MAMINLTLEWEKEMHHKYFPNAQFRTSDGKRFIDVSTAMKVLEKTEDELLEINNQLAYDIVQQVDEHLKDKDKKFLMHHSIYCYLEELKRRGVGDK